MKIPYECTIDQNKQFRAKAMLRLNYNYDISGYSGYKIEMFIEVSQSAINKMFYGEIIEEINRIKTMCCLTDEPLDVLSKLNGLIEMCQFEFEDNE